MNDKDEMCKMPQFVVWCGVAKKKAWVELYFPITSDPDRLEQALQAANEVEVTAERCAAFYKVRTHGNRAAHLKLHGWVSKTRLKGPSRRLRVERRTRATKPFSDEEQARTPRRAKPPSQRKTLLRITAPKQAIGRIKRQAEALGLRPVDDTRWTDPEGHYALQVRVSGKNTKKLLRFGWTRKEARQFRRPTLIGGLPGLGKRR